MHPLSAAELLAVWQRGVHEHPLDRALTLLSASTGEPRKQLAALSIGTRDARLIEAYEANFGASLAAFAECPRCGVRLEYRLTTSALLARAGNDQALPELSVSADDFMLRLRTISSLDLAALTDCGDVTSARRVLAERCVTESLLDGEAVAPSALPESIVELIAKRLADADPLAQILIDLTCATCQHQWQVIFDIEAFFWSKLAGAAKRLLREVHDLARAYAWRESDILALPPTRRRAYLEMVHA